MKHEKIYKNEDGSQIKVEISLYVDNDWATNASAHWKPFVSSREKGKRNWNTNHEAATPEQILEAKLEFWEKIKPQ